MKKKIEIKISTNLQTGSVCEVGFRALRVIKTTVADGSARRTNRKFATVKHIAASIPHLGRFVYQL